MLESTPSRRPSSFRRRTLVAAGAAAVLFLAACGGGSSSDDSAGSDVKQEGKAADFPVTISQKVGEVTIDEQPERVVTLDVPSADAAIALGVVPVGMTELSYIEGGVQQ